MENASVVDLNGANATVTLGPGGRVTAFVLEISGLSANEIAARLYSSSFRDVLNNSTAAIVGKASAAQVTSVLLEPKSFELPTTTMTATTGTVTVTVSSTATATSSMVATSTISGTTARYHDIVSHTTSSDTSALVTKWALFISLLAIMV